MPRRWAEWAATRLPRASGDLEGFACCWAHAWRRLLAARPLSVHAGATRVAGPARSVSLTVCGERRLTVRVASARGGRFAVALRVP